MLAHGVERRLGRWSCAGTQVKQFNANSSGTHEKKMLEVPDTEEGNLRSQILGRYSHSIVLGGLELMS